MKVPSLQNIVGFYSLKNAVFDRFTGYYNDSLIREIITFQTYHNHPIELLYIFCFSLFVLYYLIPQDYKKEKIKRINGYEKYMNFAKMFIIIFTVIFTKDIENAI